MTRWASRGYRGAALEQLILYSNEVIRKKNLGRIDRVSVPVKVIEIDEKGMIRKAFFEKKSTVDFMGVVQGIPVAFDVKETNLKNMPTKNIHEHQVEFMRDFTNQKGYAFLIVHYKSNDKYYLIPFEVVEFYYYSKEKRNIPSECLEERYLIERGSNGILNYLTALNNYIKCRKEKESKE